MLIFFLLMVFFLIALVALGLMAAATFGVVALVLLFRGSSGKGGSNRRIVGLLVGASLLGLSIVVLVPTFLLGSRIVRFFVDQQQHMNREKRQLALRDPALEDVRRFVAAEAAYQAANGGFFDTPDCLAHPRGCLPSYAGAPFLDATRASRGTRGGFVWTFHPGPPLASILAGKVSPSSLSRYAWVGTPTDIEPGAICVCGDSSGRVCEFWGRQVGAEATCPSDCIRPLVERRSGARQ